MSSKPTSAVKPPKIRVQKSTINARVVPSLSSVKSTTVNNNTPLDKNKMLEMRKQRNQSIAAAGGMANLSFFSGKMMEAFKQTGRTPDKKISVIQGKGQTARDNPEAYRSFVSSKMLEAVKVTKQSGGGSGDGGGGRPRGRPRKVVEVESSGELVRPQAISDPNDYVTPVFSLDGTSILDMVLSENLLTEESPLNNNSVEAEDAKEIVNASVPQPQMSSNKTKVKEAPSTVQPQPSSSSSSKKPFQLRQQLRLNPKKKKTAPPKIRTPRQVGEISDIRQQLLSKFSQVASKPEAVNVISKPVVKTVPSPTSASKNIKSTPPPKPKLANSSRRPSSLSLKKITPLAIRSTTPRCRSTPKKPPKQNISLADPSRKMAGAVQFMLSSAITKVLQTPQSKKRKASSTPSQSSTSKRNGSIPPGYGRPTRPPGRSTVHLRSKKGVGPNEDGSSSEEEMVDSLNKPWELGNEEEEEDEQFEEGPYEVDDVKIEVVNDEDEEDEEEMISHDPLDMPYDDNLDEDNVKIEVTNDEYNTPLFEGFAYEEGTEEGNCDDSDQAVMDIKPDISSQTLGLVIDTEPIEISTQIVKTEPQENINLEYVM